MYLEIPGMLFNRTVWQHRLLRAYLRQMRQYISAKMFQVVNLGTKLSRAIYYF